MTDQNPPEQPVWQPQPGTSPWAAPGTDPRIAPGGTPWSGPGTYPYVVPPPARPRRVRTALIWSAVVLVVSVGTGAAGYEIGVQHSRISAIVQGTQAGVTGSCAPGQSAPDPLATSPAGRVLLGRVLPMPAGDTSVKVGQQGVLSLRDYVKALYTTSPSEQERLAARCFQTAVHREWTSPSGTTTSVWLIQFGTAAGARSYALAAEAGLAGDATYSDSFGVSGVTDGKGFGQTKLDSDGNTRTQVLGDAGNVTILIHVFVPARTNYPLATSLLQQQNALLGR